MTHTNRRLRAKLIDDPQLVAFTVHESLEELRISERIICSGALQ